MTARRTKANKSITNMLQGMTKGGTYRFSPEVALELAIYGKLETHGTQKDLLEQAVIEFVKRNPIPKRLRDAALLILEQQGAK